VVKHVAAFLEDRKAFLLLLFKEELSKANL